MHELKNCPFCCAHAYVRSGSGWHGAGCDTIIFGVMCPGFCHARQHKTEEGAIVAWNRRTPTVGEASAAAAAPGASIPTWQERCGDTGPTPSMDMAARAMREEIADLRAQLALAGQCGARQEPVAWARKWHIDGETPAKKKNGNGRWAWPQKFKFYAVTPHKVFKDDVPLYATPVSAHGTQPEHETIVREGDKLVCTACGTSADAQGAQQGGEVLRAALRKIIEMNRQHALDQYGDANKAETWACIRLAREALAAAPSQAQRGTPKQHAALQELADIAQANDMGYGAPAQAQDGGQSDAKDAARYRWLRDKSEPGICAFYLSVGQAFKNVKFARGTVDEAIDAQIATHTNSAQPAVGDGGAA